MFIFLLLHLFHQILKTLHGPLGAFLPYHAYITQCETRLRVLY